MTSPPPKGWVIGRFGLNTASRCTIFHHLLAHHTLAFQSHRNKSGSNGLTFRIFRFCSIYSCPYSSLRRKVFCVLLNLRHKTLSIKTRVDLLAGVAKGINQIIDPVKGVFCVRVPRHNSSKRPCKLLEILSGHHTLNRIIRFIGLVNQSCYHMVLLWDRPRRGAFAL